MTGTGLASVLLADIPSADEGNGPPEDPPVDTLPRQGNQESVIGYADDPINPVRIGIISLGNRDTSMTQTIQTLAPERHAICDLCPEQVVANLPYLQENGSGPDVYTGSEDGWRDLVERDDLDFVFIFTNWENRVPMYVYAIEQGKHAVTEVPTAVPLEGCCDLVDTAGRTQCHCMILENVCYFEEEM